MEDADYTSLCSGTHVLSKQSGGSRMVRPLALDSRSERDITVESSAPNSPLSTDHEADSMHIPQTQADLCTSIAPLSALQPHFKRESSFKNPVFHEDDSDENSEPSLTRRFGREGSFKNPVFQHDEWHSSECSPGSPPEYCTDVILGSGYTAESAAQAPATPDLANTYLATN